MFLGEGLEEGGDGLDEVVPEGILPFDEQGAAVEVPFLVKIAQMAPRKTQALA
jgi:hypothetical protein